MQASASSKTASSPAEYVVALGGNIGSKADLVDRFRDACRRLSQEVGHVQRGSRIYESAPAGPVAEQPRFLNACVKGVTLLPPLAVLERLLAIETDFGRVRSVAGGPRTLDLDLVLYGQVQLSSARLTVPHPRALERAFVVSPLIDLLGPEARFPGVARSLLEVRNALASKAEPLNLELFPSEETLDIWRVS